MKLDFKYIILLITALLSGLSSTSKAQDKTAELIDPTSEVTKLTPEDYTTLALPPLSVFFEAAENTAKVGSLKATKEEEQGALLTTKREWMNTIRAFGNYQYGEVGALVTTAGQTMPFSGQKQSVLNAGATVSLPLDVIYDRKNRIRKQQARVKRADYDVLVAIKDVKIEIAETYTTAIQHLNTLKVRAESVVIANSDVKMSEAGYLNGNIELSALNYSKSMQATAITNYETTRAELNKAILHLELLTNVKILKK